MSAPGIQAQKVNVKVNNTNAVNFHNAVNVSNAPGGYSGGHDADLKGSVATAQSAGDSPNDLTPRYNSSSFLSGTSGAYSPSGLSSEVLYGLGGFALIAFVFGLMGKKKKK